MASQCVRDQPDESVECSIRHRCFGLLLDADGSDKSREPDLLSAACAVPTGRCDAQIHILIKNRLAVAGSISTTTGAHTGARKIQRRVTSIFRLRAITLHSVDSRLLTR